jgi:hypothetical protein
MLKRLDEIDKEEKIEEMEEAAEKKQEFLFDEEVDMSRKIKCKKDTGWMVLDNAVDVHTQEHL